MQCLHNLWQIIVCIVILWPNNPVKSKKYAAMLFILIKKFEIMVKIAKKILQVLLSEACRLLFIAGKSA